MLILFLDDDPERHALVSDLEVEILGQGPRPRGHALDHAWSAEEAAGMLLSRRYDVAFLDVDFIVDLPPPARPRKIFVHSLNNGSAPGRMVAALDGHVREAYLAPFASVIMVDELCRCIHGS